MGPWAAQGRIASPHWAATREGERVLAAGGTAVDACVATAAMLSVIYPHMCGIGGDAFMLHFDARSGDVVALNGSGRAPALASVDQFASRGLAEVPERGPLAATVPGAVGAWQSALNRYGSRSMAELLAPAARTAREGFAVTDRTADWMGWNVSTLAADLTLRRWFLEADGTPVAAGTVVRLPELANTIEHVQEQGADYFYRGLVAELVDEAMHESGGLLRASDLAEHTSNWMRPARATYRGLEVCTTPPNSQGVTALAMLSQLARQEDLVPGTAAHIDALVDAKLAAYARRDRFLADPDFVDIERESLMGTAPKDGRVTPQGVPRKGDTVYLCAVDEQGNACSMIQSIYYAFGSGFVPFGTGVLLHNRAHYFSLDSSHPNCLGPGKRPAHTLMASMALRQGLPWLVFGTMGADGQPQISVQVLERVLAGCTAQKAVEAPRVLAGRFLLSDNVDRLLVDEGIGKDVIAALRAGGHNVEIAAAGDERLGHAHAILVDPDQGLEVGVDPRSDGLPNDHDVSPQI